MKPFYLLNLIILTIFSCTTVDNNSDLPHVTKGQIIRIDKFPSEYISPRNVDIWLPEGYSDDKKYAVIYMHDGQMLFDSSKTWNKQEWGVDEVVTKLIENNRIKDCITRCAFRTSLI